jgi:HSP20 family protein
MRAILGDRIVLESERATRSPRRGVIEEILSVDPPRFSVRWSDGHLSILTPNAGSAHVVRRGGRAATRTRSKGGNRMSQLQTERRSEGSTERWDVANELEQMTERMRRMLEQTFGGLGFATRTPERAGWAPVADVEEQDDAYVVQVELPGVKPENVTIELVGNELTITGEVKEEERKGVVRRKMRRYGRFDYRIALPNQLDGEHVDAKLDDGILTVRVPKAERAQRRQIEVKKAS